MPTGPWDDWTPGVLSRQQVRRLVGEGFLSVDQPEKALGVSSVDLTLSSEAYHLPDGAIKPTGGRYFRTIKDSGHPVEIPTQGLTLEARQTYVVKLRERLHSLPGSGIYGQATAKSSVGRVDVLARLIVDGMNCYEAFSPDSVASGDLYLEITPLTFPVQVRPGCSLSQLRLFYGEPEGCQISGVQAYKTFLKDSETNDGTLSLNLRPAKISGHDVVAFRAKERDMEQYAPVPLWKSDDPPPPWKYWDFVQPSPTKRLSLRKNSFYILRSRELLALPKGVGVYCRAIDESFGEMRIHYAGFAHPWFGRGRQDSKVGTPLIFEVRGHDLNVSLQDGESMARLVFYRMSEDAGPEDADPSYEGQDLKLSQYFGPWPVNVKVGEDGTVEPAE